MEAIKTSWSVKTSESLLHETFELANTFEYSMKWDIILN